jgi:hypothetical protein
VAETLRSRLLFGLLHAFVATAILLALHAWRHRLGSAIGWTLAALVFAQGSAASGLAIHRGRAEAAATCPPAISAAAPGPRLQTALVHNTPGPAGDLDGIDASLAKMGRLGVSSLNVGCGVDGLEPYTGFATQRATRALGDVGRRLRLGGRFGATHVISEAPASREEATLLYSAVRGGAVVALTPEYGLWTIPHRPWASFAPSVVLARSQEDALESVERLVAVGDPAVVLEGPAPFATSGGRVAEVRRGTTELTVTAESSGDGVLVLNDAYHPGWKATIDGVPTEIFPADGLVRAVRWPPGRHVLEMRFAPREVAWGGWLSGLAALACVALASRRSAAPIPLPPGPAGPPGA